MQTQQRSWSSREKLTYVVGVMAHDGNSDSYALKLTALERERHVRWWIESSGLTGEELRRIATDVWADRVLAEVMDPRAA